MKRVIILSLLITWTLFLIVVSCDRHRHVIRGFVDEPQDSILIDLRLGSMMDIIISCSSMGTFPTLMALISF